MVSRLPVSRSDRFKLSGLRRDARNAPAFKRRFRNGVELQRFARFVRADDRLFFAESDFSCVARTNFGRREIAARRNLGSRRCFARFRRAAKSAVLSVYDSRAVKMRSKIIFTILLLSLTFSCTQISKEERIASINNSVFAISVVYKHERAEKRVTSGTGFLVDKNLIASAAHVQREIEKLTNFSAKNSREAIAWKKFPNGETISFPIEFVTEDVESDLAIYRFDPEKLKEHKISALKLADRLPAISEEIVSIGYYGDYESPFNSLGTVSMIDKNTEIFADLTLMPGNSGSPLCSMQTGEVFGVNVNVMAIGDGTIRLGIAKSADKLKTLLEKHRASETK